MVHAAPSQFLAGYFIIKPIKLSEKDQTLNSLLDTSVDNSPVRHGHKTLSIPCWILHIDSLKIGEFAWYNSQFLAGYFQLRNRWNYLLGAVLSIPCWILRKMQPAKNPTETTVLSIPCWILPWLRAVEVEKALKNLSIPCWILHPQLLQLRKRRRALSIPCWILHPV